MGSGAPVILTLTSEHPVSSQRDLFPAIRSGSRVTAKTRNGDTITGVHRYGAGRGRWMVIGWREPIAADDVDELTVRAEDVTNLERGQ